MLSKLVPGRLKALLRGVFRKLLHAHLPDVFPRALPSLEGFFPHHPQARCYLLPKVPEKAAFHEASPLPVPPRELWLGYGQTVEEYLVGGRHNVQALVEVIGRSGAPIASAGRILEFGCGAGRMIRWLADLTATCEVWGTDISASAIVWCQQHLTPPFHFATTTIWPHLPFEDRYFGLIYAGSVFTHLDDLADAWFLELRRILRPGGKLYITVHDRNTVALFNGREREQWLPQYLRTIPEYEKFSRSDFGMFTIGRSLHSQVFYDVDFLRRKLEPFFRVLSITEEAYNYQSAVLLERL